MLRFLTLTLLLLSVSVSLAAEEMPRSHDPRIAITLFAENPQIVTPTGIDIDSEGRVWAVESNTHFPPENYTGHPTDRVLVFTDADGDGRAEAPVVFLDGLVHTMSVAVLPVWLNLPKGPGDKPLRVVYLATRKEIFRCVDTDGDLVCDEKTSIVHLETKGDYPHNGLAGFAFHPQGELYFGFGENLGADYKIVGSEGRFLSGGGEGGNIYRAQLDGSELVQVATGFWNPHANAFDAYGRLFSVDNDPDSRPPCRLMHIIEGGDYGYRFRNGRKGLHPFTSWNGEIAGTLPMVAGTGEAPSGILACTSDAFPREYQNRLFVTSWGDHRIDSFVLKPVGASVQSVTEPLVSGGENFRPVGIACAPDGSLYCTDWVLREYKLHGRGRIWKVGPTAPRASMPSIADLLKRNPEDLKDISILGHPRTDIRRPAARLLASTAAGREHLQALLFADVKSNYVQELRLEALWALSSQDAGRMWIAEQGARLFSHDDPILVAARAALRNVPTDLRDITQRLQALTADSRGVTRGPTNLELTLALVMAGSFDSLRAAEPEIEDGDPFLFAAAINALEKSKGDLTPAWRDRGKSARMRLAATIAASRRAPRDSRILKLAMADADPLVRRAAVQWAAEARLNDFRPAIEAVLNDPAITADLFLATLAALEMLDGVKPEEFDKTPAGKYVVPIVKDAKRPASVRAIALRLIPPSDPALNADLLAQLANSPEAGLRREAVRSLAGAVAPNAAELLRSLAQKGETSLRLEAIAGLASSAQAEATGGPTRDFLLSLLQSSDTATQREAIRALRSIDASEVLKALREARLVLSADSDLEDQLNLATGHPARQRSVGEWREALGTGDQPVPAGDAEAGRRLFYHLKGPGCANCHTVDGRGGRIGPDLSTIGRSLGRDKLIDSILEPSREIAPQFVTWAMESKTGQTYSGMIVFENEGNLTLGTTDGKTLELKTADMLDRRPQEKSVMPEKLADRMTVQEFQDLLAYLTSLK